MPSPPSRQHKRPARSANSVSSAVSTAVNYAVRSPMARRVVRKAVSSVVSRVRRRVVPSTVSDKPGNSFSASSATMGKPVKKEIVAKKLLNNSIVKSKYTYRNINQLTTTLGAYPLSYSQLDVNSDWLPVFCYNLSTTRQTNDTTNVGVPFYRLYLDKVAGRLGWYEQNGRTETSGLSTGLQIEDNPGWGQTLNQGKQSLLDSATIRMCLRGKTSAPTRITIQIVQFMRESVCPETSTWLAPTPTGFGLMDAEGHETMSAVVKGLITNPCATQRRTKNYIKVLKTYTFNIDPKNSNENDTLPDQKHFKLFYRINRIMKYHTQGPLATAAGLADPQAFNDGTAGTANAVNSAVRSYPNHITSSVYMMIRSLQPSYQTAPSNALSASFDMNVQTVFKNIRSDF